jgi:hypothetical protein
MRCLSGALTAAPIKFSKSRILSYEHYGQEYYIDRSRQITTGLSESEIEKDRLAAASEYIVKYAWRNGNVAVRELVDHAPINYVTAACIAVLRRRLTIFCRR